MRVDAVLLKRIGRATAFALLGVTILATAISVRSRERAAPLPAQAAPTADPLDAELARCRAIARPEDVDDEYRAAWAEVRRRFFAPHEANEVRP